MGHWLILKWSHGQCRGQPTGIEQYEKCRKWSRIDIWKIGVQYNAHVTVLEMLDFDTKPL